jgi:hypothetical protein
MLVGQVLSNHLDRLNTLMLTGHPETTTPPEAQKQFILGVLVDWWVVCSAEHKRAHFGHLDDESIEGLWDRMLIWIKIN